MAQEQDEIIGKKKKHEITLRGVILCACFNIVLGVVLGFAVLSVTPPQDYKATPDQKTGKVPPIPTGIWAWNGTLTGDWRDKEDAFLAGQGEVTLTDAVLSGWATDMFQPAKPGADSGNTSNQPASTADKAKQDIKAAAADMKNFALTAGTPSFRVFRDPQAPDATTPSFQVTLPFKLTLLGIDMTVLYQARGTFVAGANGPQFQPYYTSFGCARVPSVAGLPKMVFNDLLHAFTASPDAQKYTDAWAKFGSATLKDDALVLETK
jgi:hypothetical protein